ncbi:hypothetical protein FQZ97_898810 [compost metagenome]
MFAMPSAVPARAAPASVASSVYATPCQADTHTPLTTSSAISARRSGRGGASVPAAITSAARPANSSTLSALQARR